MLRTRADDREREGANTAPCYRLVADELRAMFDAYLDEVIDVQTAAKESGYTEMTLRTMRHTGKLPNKLTRRVLPRKPGHGIDKKGPRPDGTLKLAMGATR